MEESRLDRGSKATKVYDNNIRINMDFRKDLFKPTFLLERLQSYKSLIIIIIIINFKFIPPHQSLGVGPPVSPDFNKKSKRFTAALHSAVCSAN